MNAIRYLSSPRRRQAPAMFDAAGTPPSDQPVRRMAVIGTPPGLGLRPTVLAASPRLLTKVPTGSAERRAPAQPEGLPRANRPTGPSSPCGATSTLRHRLPSATATTPSHSGGVAT
jgi:hypothetical protein